MPLERDIEHKHRNDDPQCLSVLIILFEQVSLDNGTESRHALFIWYNKGKNTMMKSKCWYLVLVARVSVVNILVLNIVKDRKSKSHSNTFPHENISCTLKSLFSVFNLTVTTLGK